MKPLKIPKRVSMSECFYVKVVFINPSEIQMQRGEWAASLEEDEPCIGVIRISNQEPLESQWWIFLHELDHAMNDFRYVAVTDHWATTYEEKARIEDGEN